MRPILYSVVAIVVIAVGSNFVLDTIGFSSAEKSAGQAVRLGEADQN